MTTKKLACRLEYFNIAFFASIMGFGGLALATHKFEKTLGLSYHLGEYILYFTSVCFVLVCLAYVGKIFLNFGEVFHDFRHPVKSNFFPGIGKIFLILSLGFLELNHTLAQTLFFLGITLQFMFAVVLFRRWILHEMEMNELNPLRFLPIVGNLLVPLAGVPLGYVELSWFFFSIGFVMWGVMFTVIMNRIIFHHPLPAKLMPTLFILVAPGSVVSLAYTQLHGGQLTDLSRIAYYFSVFIFLMILSKFNILMKLKFYMSWWAYSFPLAVLTNATFVYFTQTKASFLLYLAIGFYILLVVLIVALLIRTVLGMRRKEICIEE